MRIKKSIQMEGWIGFFDNDEYGHPEEFLSVKSIDKAQKIVNQLQKDIKNLTKHTNSTLDGTMTRRSKISPKRRENGDRKW